MAANKDPLEDFSFVVNWGGTRTGMLRVSPLRWSTTVVDHRSGSNILNATQKAPGLPAYAPITVERESESGDTEFQTREGGVANTASVAFRADVSITQLEREHNPQGG